MHVDFEILVPLVTHRIIYDSSKGPYFALPKKYVNNG